MQETQETRKSSRIQRKVIEESYVYDTLQSGLKIVRKCQDCSSTYTSGHWCSDSTVKGGYICQKCYRRRKRVNTNIRVPVETPSRKCYRCDKTESNPWYLHPSQEDEKLCEDCFKFFERLEREEVLLALKRKRDEQSALAPPQSSGRSGAPSLSSNSPLTIMSESPSPHLQFRTTVSPPTTSKTHLKRAGSPSFISAVTPRMLPKLEPPMRTKTIQSACPMGHRPPFQSSRTGMPLSERNPFMDHNVPFGTHSNASVPFERTPTSVHDRRLLDYHRSRTEYAAEALATWKRGQDPSRYSPQFSYHRPIAKPRPSTYQSTQINPRPLEQRSISQPSSHVNTTEKTSKSHSFPQLYDDKLPPYNPQSSASNQGYESAGSTNSLPNMKYTESLQSNTKSEDIENDNSQAERPKKKLNISHLIN